MLWMPSVERPRFQAHFAGHPSVTLGSRNYSCYATKRTSTLVDHDTLACGDTGSSIFCVFGKFGHK